jgi:hypothetical protein
MSRTAKSLQVIWQTQFQKDYILNPFVSESRTNLSYQKLDNPATWWFNPTNPNSLRLTRPVYSMLIDAKVPTFKFKLTEKYRPKTFVQLERYFTSPYYLLNAQTIVMFGETEAMMMALHANNLQQYLDNQGT